MRKKDTNIPITRAERYEKLEERRKRNISIKNYFRNVALETVGKFYGDNSERIDAVFMEGNCTREIVKSIAATCSSHDFELILKGFLRELELRGKKLEKTDLISDEITKHNQLMKENLTVCTIELLMKSEDEELVLKFLKSTNEADRKSAGIITNAMIELAATGDYIVSIPAFAQGFIADSGKMTELIQHLREKVGSIPHDLVLPEVVETVVGIELESC